MAQQKTLHVPIAGGMRQDMSEHSAPVGTLTDALNVRFTTEGEVESRPGTNALSLASDGTTAYSTMLAATGPGLLGRLPGSFFIGAGGYGFRYDFGKSRLFQSGSYSNAEPLGILETIAREDTVNGSVAVPFPLSQAAKNGYTALVYSTGNGQGGNGPTDNIMVCKVFTSSGAIAATVQRNDVSAAWVISDASNVTDFILITQSTTNVLSATVMTTSASGVTIVGAVAVGTLTTNAAFWAPCTWPGIGWALAYQSLIGTMTLKKLTGSTSLASQTFLVTGFAPVSAYADATNLYVGWRESSGPSTAVARVYDTSLVDTSGGAKTLSSAPDTDYGPPLFGPSGTSSTSAMYAITRASLAAVTTSDYIQVGVLTSAGADVFPITKFYQCAAASSPFGNGYLWVRAGGINANTSHSFHRELMLDFMSIRAGNAVTIMAPVIALTGVDLFIGASSAAYGAGWYRQHLGVPALTDAGNWIMGIPRIVREEDTQAVSGTGLALAEWLTFSIGGRRQSARLGNVLAVAGFPTLTRGLVGSKYYDPGLETNTQRNGNDLGFPLPPAVSGSMSASTGALSFLSTYQFSVVVERVESDGTRWRSAPSEVVTLGTSATTNTLSVAAAMYTAWLRPDDRGGIIYNGNKFVLHVYRTLANGSTFYRSTPPQGAPSPGTDGSFAYTDGLPDATLALREILYTDGGVLPNDCPPSARFIRATEDRVWLGGLWEEEELQSSKIIVPGEPPQFNDSPAFRVTLPEACTGIAIQDGVVIAFTKNAIYAIQGLGPNDQGQGDWGSPRVITRSTGCISHLSILETSIGVFFQSEVGIEILPRGLGEPQFIGMPVQDLMYSSTLSAVAKVISAAVVTTFRGRTARFIVDDGSAIDQVLVYDLDMKTWSRDKYGAYVSAVVDTDSGAVVATQAMSGNFGALQEDLASDRDSVGNSPAEIVSSLAWAELRPFGIAGQGRFTGATGLFDAKDTPSSGYRAGNATLTLSVDSRAEIGRTFVMTSLTETQAYQRNVPSNDVGCAGKLTLSTSVGGWRFMGWTVEADDMGGSRRMGETEQG